MIDDQDVRMPAFLLAGQSNMQGGVVVAELPDAISWPASVTVIGPAGVMDPSTLQKGGPEWGMALAWQEHCPDTACVFVKHAVGGMNLANEWNPGAVVRLEAEPEMRQVCWPELVRAKEQAQVWAAAAGHELAWRGFAWMQGERDCTWPGMAQAYKAHLHDLLQHVRSLAAVHDLSAAIGLVTPRQLREDLSGFRHAHREIVRAAQRTVVADDPHAVLIETDDLPQKPDNLHFTTLASLVLGRRFMAALLDRSQLALPFGGAAVVTD